MCGVVAILGVSCQLNTMTRTLLRVLKKKFQPDGIHFTEFLLFVALEYIIR
jgi:hypothetical protein